MDTLLVDELDAGESLAAAGRTHRVRKTAESDIFRLAAHIADLYNPDSRPSSGPVLPGRERTRRFGGLGTPLVWEFAVADLAVELEMSTGGARFLIQHALDTRHRLPLIWDRVCAGEVKVGYARHVAQQTHHLTLEAAGLVDAGVAESADGRISWSRFEDLVAGKVIDADPAAAAAKEAEAASRQFAKATRSSEHGMKGFYLRSTTGVIARFDATVAYLAEALKALGDLDNEDLRRVKACLIMANPVQAIELLQAFANHRSAETDGELPIGEGDEGPGDNDADDPSPCATCGGDTGMAGNPEPFTKPFRPRDIQADGSKSGSSGEGFTVEWSKLLPKLLPTVTLYLHLSQDTIIRDTGGVARWEGEGPISAQYLRDHLGLRHGFVVKPVIDCANMAPVDAYEIPHRHRQAVHLRTPADAFPYSSNTTRDVDIDHTVAHVPPDQGGPPGQSSLGNYTPMVRFHHRIKTHGPWEVRQPFPGIYIWRTAMGEYYLVDHTGTRKISDPKCASRGGKSRHHNPDLAIQMFLDRPPVDYEYTHAA